jgi:pSer/pThr/pTyr-binding forkhead associated (FHA) protein
MSTEPEPFSSFSSELDDYIQSTTTTANNATEEWTYDAILGVYVIHSQRLVMYHDSHSWICGDYDTFYNPTASIRLVILSSPHYKAGQVVIIDDQGVSIGRDRAWDARLRLPQMIVSKCHALIYFDKPSLFYIVDHGSQHGTFVNGTRLSPPKQSSLPHPLQHGDVLTIGDTQLQVHDHIKEGVLCQACASSQELVDTRAGKKQAPPLTKPSQTVELESSRRAWNKQTKRELQIDSDNNKDNYVDRAQIRRKRAGPEKIKKQQEGILPEQIKKQQEGTLPEQITKNTVAVEGIGNKMLKKLGWQEGQSLGKRQDGILEPIVPITQTDRTGLGSIPETRKDKQLRLTQQRYHTNNN